MSSYDDRNSFLHHFFLSSFYIGLLLQIAMLSSERKEFEFHRHQRPTIIIDTFPPYFHREIDSIKNNSLKINFGIKFQ